VETERVGSSPLTAALRRHARSGAPATLVIGRATHLSARERGTIARLEADGVAVGAPGRTRSSRWQATPRGSDR
jgi:hypothetical protein